MKLMRSFVLVLVAAVLTISCSDSATDSGDPPITVADLVGSWTASSATFTNNANSSETFDIVAEGGETRVTVLAGGGARTWVELGDFSDEWDALLTIVSDNLTSTPVETSRDVRVWTFTLVGSVLTLTDTTSEFDFTLTGVAGVPATEVVVFVRQ